MLRKSLVILCVLALASLVSAQPMANTVNVNLVIDLYQSVDWQTDLNIDFGAVGGGPYDWNCSQLQGMAYSAGPDPGGKMYATDPWAGDPNGYFYESYDQVDVFVWSNGGMSMTVTPGGDMTGVATGHTLPTYFTAAGHRWNPGFMADGNVYGGAGAPLTTPGTDGQYLHDGSTPPAVPNFGFIAGAPPGGSAWTFPNQNAFPMVGGPYSLVMTQVVSGTFTFHARVERNGINDPADTYTNTLAIAFGP